MVDISDDPALRNWGEWAVANGVSRQHRRSLNKAGGGKDQTWWLYFGVLPATCFYLTDMATGREFDDWPELAEAIRLLPMDVFEQQDIVGFIEHHLAIVETGA
jgi:hypothetical protein